MKKIYFCLIMVLAVSAVGLTSCDKEDDPYNENPQQTVTKQDPTVSPTTPGQID